MTRKQRHRRLSHLFTIDAHISKLDAVGSNPVSRSIRSTTYEHAEKSKVTVGIGALLIQRFPFPDDNALLQLVAAEKPLIFLGIKYAYQAMLFSTPFIGCSMLFSLIYIFFVRPGEVAALTHLPLPGGSRPGPGSFSWSGSYIIRSARNLPRSLVG